MFKIKIQPTIFLASLTISLFLFTLPVSSQQIKKISLRSGVAHTVIVNLKKLELKLYDNTSGQTLLTTNVGIGFANKYPECAGKSDNACGYGSSYYGMSLVKTPVISAQLWAGGKLSSDDAVSTYGFPFKSVCDTNFRPPNTSQLEKCANGYSLDLTLHGSPNPSGYSSHGCVRVSVQAISKIRSYLSDDNQVNWIEIIDSDYEITGLQTQQRSTPTNTQTQQPERSNLSTNGIIRKPRPIPNTPRTTTPSTGSTPSNSGSDKPKQSCSAIQSEINRITNNKKAYSNADQQISTRQAKIDNNQCT